jgi:P pilus assembly chaperone PapD
MLSRALPALLPLLAALAAFPAGAGSFQVVPIYIYLQPSNPRTTITVANTGEQEVTVQLRATRWTQDELGRDLLEPTSDLVFFPRILKIASGQERIVRVGLDKPRSPGEESAYRLFVRELPVGEPGELTLRVAIEMSLPVFLSAARPSPRPAVAGAELRQGSALLRLRNTGNTHVLFKRLRVTGLDEAGGEVFSLEQPGWYVLPGAERGFALALPPDPCRGSRELRLTAESEEGLLEQRLPVDPLQCLPPPETEKQDPSRVPAGGP